MCNKYDEIVIKLDKEMKEKLDKQIVEAMRGDEFAQIQESPHYKELSDSFKAIVDAMRVDPHMLHNRVIMVSTPHCTASEWAKVYERIGSAGITLYDLSASVQDTEMKMKELYRDMDTTRLKNDYVPPGMSPSFYHRTQKGRYGKRKNKGRIK